MKNESSLALYSTIESSPNALQQIGQMGEMLAKSGMFGCDKTEQGVVLAMACITHRMTPIQINQKYHLVGGKLQKRSGAALAEFREMGGSVRWIKTGQEPVTDPMAREAVGEFSLGDGDPMVVSFSMLDARNAGLIKAGSAWTTFPWKMLRARVISDAIGMLAPEIYFSDDSAYTETPDQTTTLFQQPETNNETESENYQSEAIDVETVSSQGIEPDQASREPAVSVLDAEEEQGTEKARRRAETTSTPAVADPVDGGSGRGSLEKSLLTNLAKVVRGNEEAALKYLRSIKWLEEGQDMSWLTPARARQVIGNAEAFLAKALEG
tara:strand:+ start:3429 stop:4400 length:972 start_codon:yes stop_codon:yes gene_type:complete